MENSADRKGNDGSDAVGEAEPLEGEEASVLEEPSCCHVPPVTPEVSEGGGEERRCEMFLHVPSQQAHKARREIHQARCCKQDHHRP
eukprot:754819-Hanusia_phi.AAC.2